MMFIRNPYRGSFCGRMPITHSVARSFPQHCRGYSQRCPTGFFKETGSNFPIANSVGRWLFPIDKFVTSAVGRWLFPIDIYGEGVADRPGVRSSLATALPSATRSVALRAFVDGYQYEAKILFCAWLDADTRKQARMCVGTYTRTFPPHE